MRRGRRKIKKGPRRTQKRPVALSIDEAGRVEFLLDRQEQLTQLVESSTEFVERAPARKDELVARIEGLKRERAAFDTVLAETRARLLKQKWALKEVQRDLAKLQSKEQLAKRRVNLRNKIADLKKELAQTGGAE